jgi:thiamine transport system permease protein
MGKNNESWIIPLVFLWLFFLAFFVYPVVVVFSKVFSIDALFRAFRVFHVDLLLNSFSQAFVSTLISFIIGFPIAYILANRDFPGRRVLMAISLVPFVFPSVLVVLSFVIVFGNNGWLNNALAFFGLPRIFFLYGFWGIVLAHAFYNFPIVMRFVSDAWERIGSRLPDAAKSLGANSFQVFFRIILPQLFPSIVSSCSLVFIYCFTSFAIVLAFGGLQFTNFEAEIYRQIFRNLDLSLGAVLAFFQFVILLVVSFLYLYYSEKFGVAQYGFLLKRKKLNFFSWFGFFEFCIVFIVFLFVTLPVLAVLVFAFDLDSGFLNFRAFLKILNFQQGIVEVSPLKSVFYSLVIAFFSSLISVFLGFIGSIYVKRFSFVNLFFVSSIAVSVVTLGFGYYLGFGVDGGNILMILIGHSVLSFPFAFRILSNAFLSVQKEVFDAAFSLGANKFQRFYLVYFPMLKYAFFAAFAFSFAVSLGELGLTLILYDGVYATMPVYIYRLISTYDFRAAAAMGFLLFLLSFLCFYVIERFSRYRQVVL